MCDLLIVSTAAVICVLMNIEDAKIVLGVASLWLASPIDLIPDFIPIVGSLDDAIVAALALRFVLSTTDGAVVREHWHGDPATLERLLRIVSWGGRGTPRALS